MNEPTAIVLRDLPEAKSFSNDLAKSQLIPAALKKRPEDVLAIVLCGQELGLAPMQSIRGIHIINGKPTLSADVMGALVKRSSACEYLQLSESGPDVATYRTKRRGEPGETVMSFTLAQARKAQITGNPTWAKYPDAMLRARCLAAICRAVYPDLCLGLYDSDSGEVAEEREITPQKSHVDEVKAALRKDLEPVDAEFTEAPTLDDAIKAATDLAALTALLPRLKALQAADARTLGPLYKAKRAELEQIPDSIGGS